MNNTPPFLLRSGRNDRFLDAIALVASIIAIAAVLVMAWSATTMSQTVQLTVPMPANLVRLRFSKAIEARLHFLLDEQGRKGRCP